MTAGPGVTGAASTETARRLGVLSAVVVALAVVVLVAFRRPATPAAAWAIADGPGFSVAMPAAPAVHPVAGGTAGADTAVVEDRDYTVVWFAVDAGTPPTSALGQALNRLSAVPASVVASKGLEVGPFAADDLTARLGPDYVHGRLIEVGTRAYLVAEVTPELNPPSDLNQLLAGFDPDLSAP